MGWLAIVELILEFLRLVLKERAPRGGFPVRRLIQVYRSKRFREWVRTEKGINPETL